MFFHEKVFFSIITSYMIVTQVTRCDRDVTPITFISYAIIWHREGYRRFWDRWCYIV